MKKIAFTQRVEYIEAYQETRDAIDQRMVKFIYALGYLPIAVPNDERIAADLLDELGVAGIILTGGNSLVKYGGDAPERDAVDKLLIRGAIDKNMPLLGICRGMQSILDYFGSTLEDVTGHVKIWHEIAGELSRKSVNSFHNQGALGVKPPLRVLAKSHDGIVEAVRHELCRIMGIMWHPEREERFAVEDIMLFREFFA